MGRLGDGVDDKIVSAAVALTAYPIAAFWYRNATAPAQVGVAADSDAPLGWNSSSDQGFGFSWDHDNLSFVQAWFVYDGAFNALKYTTALLANTWYHVMLGRDSGNVWRAYLNGTQEVTSAAGAAQDAGAELVGALAGVGGTAQFDNGNIAELGVWGAATGISQAQMNTLATELNAGFSPDQADAAGLARILYWALEGFDSPETDKFGQGRSGTVTGTTSAVHPPAMMFPATRSHMGRVNELYVPVGVVAY